MKPQRLGNVSIPDEELIKDKKECKTRIEQIKKIWNKKDIIIIEGEKTRLGVGNDLFDNSKTLQRILAPSTNAFDKYDKIVEAVKKQKKESIFLISLKYAF